MKATIARNKICVGKNSMSYNDKHRPGPVVYGEISSALRKAVIVDAAGRKSPDVEECSSISWVGSTKSKPEIHALYG